MPLAATLRGRLREEYLQYQEQLTPEAREMLYVAAMCDPKFKGLEWHPGCSTQVQKQKQHAAFNVRLAAVAKSPTLSLKP